MPTNAERFIAAYNRITKYLREETNKRGLVRNGYQGFAEALREVAKWNRMVDQLRLELMEYGDLRNAIVHERTEPEYIIAEPHPDVVRRIEWIVDLLEKPPLLLPRFAREVLWLRADEPLEIALSYLQKYDFSQFPVYSGVGHFIGLLSEKCIARWLSNCMDNHVTDLSTAKVQNALCYDETKGKNYRFLKGANTIYDAVGVFQRHLQEREPPIEAILITANGSSKEKLLGIITIWDIIQENYLI